MSKFITVNVYTFSVHWLSIGVKHMLLYFNNIVMLMTDAYLHQVPNTNAVEADDTKLHKMESENRNMKTKDDFNTDNIIAEAMQQIKCGLNFSLIKVSVYVSKVIEPCFIY